LCMWTRTCDSAKSAAVWSSNKLSAVFWKMTRRNKARTLHQNWATGNCSGKYVDFTLSTGTNTWTEAKSYIVELCKTIRQLSDKQKRNENDAKPRTWKEILLLQPTITIMRNLTFP
jgi:predicted metal-binding protein